MRKALLSASLVLLLIGAGIVMMKRCHSPAAATVSSAQVAWTKGYETGYPLGKQSAAQGNDAPKDWLLHSTGLDDASKAHILVDREQFADGYEAGFRAGFNQFWKGR